MEIFYFGNYYGNPSFVPQISEFELLFSGIFTPISSTGYEPFPGNAQQ